MPKIIGITGVSGSGKTTISRALSERLGQATTVHWDEYDDLAENPTISPDNYFEWHQRGGGYEEWRADSLEHTLNDLKANKPVQCPITKSILQPSPFVIFDTGLGYRHYQTGQHIDYSVFLDTPLDICLCRRILRNYREPKGTLDGVAILEELYDYLEKSRPLFQLSYQKQDYDLAVDGAKNTLDIVDEILIQLRRH